MLIAAITALILIPYLLVLVSLLRKRMSGWPTAASPFNLGTWGLPLTVVGIVWVVAVIIDAAWPRDATNPPFGPLPIIEDFAIAILVLGGIWWFLALRGRASTAAEPSAV